MLINKLWKIIVLCLEFPFIVRFWNCLIYNSLLDFFIESDLISSNQSGFKPYDSCINQLFPITHQIYNSFDDGCEITGIFLDVSKVFDKIWHNGLIYKFKQNGVGGNLLN